MSWDTLALGILLGIVVLTVVYDGLLYVVLRERFLVWHAARMSATVVMTLLAAPLFLGGWLESIAVRNHAELLAMDIAVACTGPFLATFIEPDKMGSKLRRALYLTVPLCGAAAVITFIAPDSFWMNMVRHTCFLGVVGLMAAGVVVPLRRGSIAARFQLAAWSILYAIAIVAIMHEILYDLEWPLWHSAILVAIAAEAIVSALGVARRFMTLRRANIIERHRAKALEEMTRLDPLTGVANWRGLEARLADSGARAVRGIAVLDIDWFRSINNTYGHVVGDKVLIAVGNAISSEGRFAARLGGEEFALLLTGDDIAAEAEYSRLLITTSVKADVPEIEFPVTASMGVVRYDAEKRFEDLFKAADDALLNAKAKGRDRSVQALGEGVAPAGRVNRPPLAA